MRHSHSSLLEGSQIKSAEQERRQIFKSILELKSLPTPSPTILSAIALLRDEEVDVGKLVDAIERDQSLVAKLLKMVNSSFYMLKDSVDSVSRAVSLLGLYNIKSMVYSAAVMDLFAKDQQEEWEHSYSSSVLMGAVVKECRLGGLSSLPLSMILHDIGKVVLRKYCSGKYNFAAMLAASGHSSLPDLEFQFLHVNHAEAGALLLKKWDVSERIVIPIFQHHMAEVPYEYVLETALVQFVNWVDCQARGMPCPQPSQALLGAAGLDIVDAGFWTGYQSRLIERLKSGSATARGMESVEGRVRLCGASKSLKTGSPQIAFSSIA